MPVQNAYLPVRGFCPDCMTKYYDDPPKVFIDDDDDGDKGPDKVLSAALSQVTLEESTAAGEGKK